jgi:hypothetical protein
LDSINRPSIYRVDPTTRRADIEADIRRGVDAHALGTATGRTVYDCMYVALAARLNTRSITADDRLEAALKRFPAVAPHIQLLQTFGAERHGSGALVGEQDGRKSKPRSSVTIPRPLSIKGTEMRTIIKNATPQKGVLSPAEVVRRLMQGWIEE